MYFLIFTNNNKWIWKKKFFSENKLYLYFLGWYKDSMEVFGLAPLTVFMHGHRTEPRTECGLPCVA